MKEETLKKIKSIIVDRGLKQTVIAKQAGISKEHLSRILTGKQKSFSSETMFSICKVLGIPTNLFEPNVDRIIDKELAHTKLDLGLLDSEDQLLLTRLYDDMLKKKYGSVKNQTYFNITRKKLHR